MMSARHTPWMIGSALCLALVLSNCGEIDIRDGVTAGNAYCEDMDGAYHFKVLVPPWKYSKEYKCSQMDGRNCAGTWNPTGRYIFVVSDIPFVNYDSEIISSLHVEILSATNTLSKANQLIREKSIGSQGSNAEFYDDDDYPREVTTPDGLSGHEVLWRQNREFEGTAYNWYRRDVFLKGEGRKIYHLQLFSIDFLDKPEFDAIIETFREGPSPDGAPDCQCRDEHADGVQDC